MPKISSRTIGTCGHCRGPVTVPIAWMGVNNPAPTCERCGTTAKESFGPIVPMNPAPTREDRGWSCEGQIPVRVPRETMARVRAYATARAISNSRAIVEIVAAQFAAPEAPAPAAPDHDG